MPPSIFVLAWWYKQVSVSQDRRAWWQYAGKCVRGSIQQYQEQWSWKRIAERRAQRIEYMQLYRRVHDPAHHKLGKYVWTCVWTCMCMGMCVGMCMDMCVGMCMDMCVDMCVDTCVGMCMEVCKDMLVNCFGNFQIRGF